MSRPDMRTLTPPSTRGGMMSSKYANMESFGAPAGRKIAPLVGNSTAPPKVMATKSKPLELASDETFLGMVERSHAMPSKPVPQQETKQEAAFSSPTSSPAATTGATVAIALPDTPKKSNARLERYLVLTHDAAPSVSFWVPNMKTRATDMLTDPPASPTTRMGLDLPKPPSSADASVATIETIKPPRSRIDGVTNASEVFEDVIEPWRPTATFKDLPLGVLEGFFQHLRRKSDKRALTLASKRRYGFLVKHLYDEVLIRIETYTGNQEVLSNMAAATGHGESLNPGIKYIRRLEFYTEDPTNVDSRAYFLPRILVHVLRGTQLEWFSWPTTVPVDPSILYELWDPLSLPLETKLSNLQLSEGLWATPASNGTKDALVRLLQATGKNLKHLEIAASTSAGLAAVPVLLTKMRQYSGPLKTFIFDLSSFDASSEGGCVPNVPVLTHLFGLLPPLQPLRTPQNGALTKVVFKCVDLSTVTNAFLKAMSLRNLEHLELLRCPFAGRLMNAVIAPSNANMEVLRIDHDVNDAGKTSLGHEDAQEITDALHRCLKRFAASFRVLHVRVRGHVDLPLHEAQLRAPRLQSLHFDLAHAEPRSGVLKEAERESRALHCIFQTSFFAAAGKVDCTDLAIATAGDAWANGRQLRKAFLEDATFQKQILRYASPMTLTIIMSRRALSLLYDNPAQRLKSSADDSQTSLMEKTIAREIATVSLTAEHCPQGSMDDPCDQWQSESVMRVNNSNSLKLVVVAVQSEIAGAVLTTRHCFVRGDETITIDGVTVKRAVAVPVEECVLNRMGMDVPKYFD